MTLRPGEGSPSAQIMIVGEAFGETEERTGVPFSGTSGQEMNRMLHEAGIMRSACYVTNVINARPPGNNLDVWLPTTKSRITSDMVRVRDKFVKPIVKEGYEALCREIEMVKPRLIIALGNTALWALTGQSGIVKWRGSLLGYGHNGGELVRVVPTIHPAGIMRQWEMRNIAIQDFRRAKRELEKGYTPTPKYDFTIKPSFNEAISRLATLRDSAETGELWLDFDIETVCGHIRCFAITWSPTEAICIPLMHPSSLRGYWSADEEGQIIWRIYRLFTHPNVKIRGQNLLYDFQYIYRHWHFIPLAAQDTMISHHVLWAGMPKSLAFQASIYADYYVYWKEMVRHNETKAGE